MSRTGGQNLEFQEWWNKQRDFLDQSSSTSDDDNNSNNGFLTVEIHSPTDQTVEKARTRSARKLSSLWRLKFHQLATSLLWLTNAAISIIVTANRRIAAAESSSFSPSPSRLYRKITFFLILVILWLCFELAAYHFSPPAMAEAEAEEAVEGIFAQWLVIRAEYLPPLLRGLANGCIVFFLIRVMAGCSWIKFRRTKLMAAAENGGDVESLEDYSMVPMCTEKECVASSPSLKAHKGNNNDNNSPFQDLSELANSSQEESSLSEQVPNVANGLKASNELNSRNRKAASQGKAKEAASKDAECTDNSNTKRSKPTEANGKESSPAKAEEEAKGSGDEKQNKANSKPPEPPKDYIHVRARRGQATDSHSLAERARREKISERMKLLQDLVPGCNKATGKAAMLDEIINYVQSVQRQVEFLSMKLASVNTRPDFNMDTHMLQSNNQLPHPILPLDSSASANFGHQPQQNPALHSNISNGTVAHCSVDHPLDTGPCQNLNVHLPLINGFNQSVPQMGFGQNPNEETALQPQHFHGKGQTRNPDEN